MILAPNQYYTLKSLLSHSVSSNTVVVVSMETVTTLSASCLSVILKLSENTTERRSLAKLAVVVTGEVAVVGFRLSSYSFVTSEVGSRNFSTVVVGFNMAAFPCDYACIRFEHTQL